ncbi:MAG TPA: sigma-70 family RNA polymerase sigma factor [Bryobacteraceae bacterium]|jgi:RNA polymerase sigma-70 factor (ECF subfamily)|nr:sigma-70 family RNA polymerase sigma factor [Bryobacteraceae bacterium]
MTAPGISDDDRLVRAAAAGDRAAFGELYVRYARLVHGILLARVPPAEADDLVQDVFLSAMRQLRGLRTVAAFRGWLAAIARNRAMDYFRQARPQTGLEDGMQSQSPTQASALGALEVLDLIRRLPEAYRETLILRLVEGMTGPEIARETGLTADSVRVNLCRGMKLLRGLWGDGDTK